MMRGKGLVVPVKGFAASTSEPSVSFATIWIQVLMKTALFAAYGEIETRLKEADTEAACAEANDADCSADRKIDCLRSPSYVADVKASPKTNVPLAVGIFPLSGGRLSRRGNIVGISPGRLRRDATERPRMIREYVACTQATRSRP